MDRRYRGIFSLRLFIGLLIMAAGVILLLEKMEVIPGVNILDYWPVILILIGLAKLLRPGGWMYNRFFWGIIITAVGVLFLLNNLHYLHFGLAELWPILIIVIGFELIRASLFKHRMTSRWKTMSHEDQEKFKQECCSRFSTVDSEDTDFVNISAILGGGKYKFINQKLKGGIVSTIMGGCEIDLRKAEMEGDSMILETSSIMGGIEIHVPAHWHVAIQGTPILGGMENKTVTPENPVKKLFIRGYVIMGGVEIKN